MMLSCNSKHLNFISLAAIVIIAVGRRGVFAAGERKRPGRLDEHEQRIIVSEPKRETQTEQTEQTDYEQVKPSECTNYNLKVFINFEYYSCCGGLKNSTVKNEDAYPNLHCNPSRLRYADLIQSKSFNCSGPEGQSNAKRRCSERWGWLDEPEKCWMWSECFAGACAEESVELGRSTKAESAFCGDGRCDATVESSSNCPIDCCQGVNPKCVAVNNTCPEACCGESHCCDGPLSDSLRFAQMFWKIVLGILASLLVLINVICCCCCYCCYSKCCKKTRRYSQIDLEMPHSHHRR